jgi:hypothetical protein
MARPPQQIKRVDVLRLLNHPNLLFVLTAAKPAMSRQLANAGYHLA